MVEGDSARILVVDDDAGTRRSLAEILTRAGHEVIQAANGLEASRLWPHVELDLVIVDLFMPEKDGIETILELQAFSRAMPIIAISGDAGPGSRFDMLRTAELLGAVRSIEKPFSAATILEAVRQALKGGQQST
jgi:CheY-like chemotaxis protein